MFAFSVLIPLLHLGCTSESTPSGLPTSIQSQESWLQTSRQVRYPLTKTQTWEGWILHPNTTATEVTLVHFTEHPTFERWIECIRQHSTPNHIWLEQSNDKLTLEYAKSIAPTLPINRIAC